jgi:hypothetical protein
MYLFNQFVAAPQETRVIIAGKVEKGKGEVEQLSSREIKKP